MLTYGKVALRAPKSELLDCVEEGILANILELFHACRKVGAWGTEGQGGLGAPTCRDGRSLSERPPSGLS